MSNHFVLPLGNRVHLLQLYIGLGIDNRLHLNAKCMDCEISDHTTNGTTSNSTSPI
jgi:hypothetical protein